MRGSNGRAEPSSASIERAQAASAVDRQVVGRCQPEHSHGQHPLGAVEQAEPLLRLEAERLQPVTGENVTGRDGLAVVP